MRGARRTRTIGRACGLLCAIAAAGCGGGGGGGGGGTTVTSLGRFEVPLSGANETTVTDPDAKGFAILELESDGTLACTVAAQAAWGGDVTATQLRAGAAGADGALVADLLGGATVDPTTHVAQHTVTIPADMAAQIAADPTQFHVNVTTGAAADGLVRAQLRPAQAHEWHAVCVGGQETPANGSAARAVAALRVDETAALTYVIALRGLGVGDVTLSHVHEGPAGVAGGILVDLDPASATADPVAGTLTRTLPLPDATLARIALDPAGYYVNVHTTAFPVGEVRGQLETRTEEVWAHLRGDRELVIADGAARGGATLELQSFTAGRAIVAVPVPLGIGTVTGAHLREGDPGLTGPVRIDLMAGGDFESSTETGSGEGTISFDAALYARLLVNPARFYVEFETAAAPNGLMREQCTQATETLVALLAAANEVPPAAGEGSGKLRVFLTGVHACNFSLDLTSPAPSDVTGLHVHDGVAGVNGPILIDLFGGSHAVAGSEILGSTTFTGRTFARLLADAAAFYGNAHTAAAPGGAEREQLLLLTEDSPPAGLAYDSPVTYATGAPISNNVPDSLGGAITSFGVSPPLPAGLALDPVTGTISGTPTALAAAADYTVTASNAAGSTTATVNVTVVEGPPTSLAYTTPVVYVTGSAITPDTPTATGGAITSWSVSPALPAGLSLGALNGAISGTPTAATAAADYTVTGSNGAGSVQALVNIRVDQSLQPPSGLSYSTPVVYATGTAITPNTPTVGGGPVSSYAVSPALPAGLSLNTSTGVISGTPTTVTAAANYTVTATNAAGSTTAVVNITVNLGAPSNLVYNNNPAIGYVSGGTFPTMTPSSSGGTPTSWSISPALPAGISISTSTGVISGSPSTTSPQTSYTVTASNSAGSTTATVTITILP